MSLEKSVSDLVQRLSEVQNRLTQVESQLASGPPPSASGGASASGDSSAFVNDFQNLIEEFIQPFVKTCGSIDPGLQKQGELVLKAVEAQKDFLQIASVSKKPADSDFPKLLEATSTLMASLREAIPRSDPLFNNYSTVSEGIVALAWVTIPDKPVPYINESKSSSEFYSNRILQEHKSKDENQVNFSRQFNGFLQNLASYVKQYHTTGVVWSASGGDALSNVPKSAPKAAPQGGPPPPMPDKPLFDVESMKSTPSGDGKPAAAGALFAEINSAGGNITGGLKKVTKDMKTKNQPPVSSLIKGGAPKKSPKTATPAKPPKFALEGLKWVVDYQIDNKEIKITDTEPKHTVYLYKCERSTVVISGKINSVTLDNCTRTAVVFENVIASCEIVNCKSVEIQCTGTASSFIIDSSSGVQLYLSDGCRSVSEIVHSKSSEMNVFLPGENEGDDGFELSIPEQFKTFIDKNVLVTDKVVHE